MAPASLQALLSGGARVTEAAKVAWSGLVQAGDAVVDATCGNGHDTLALARLVGPSGCIIALDVQARLQVCGCRYASCLRLELLGDTSLSIELRWSDSASQAEAVDSTRQHLQRQVPADQMPDVRLVNSCHSQLQVQ